MIGTISVTVYWDNWRVIRSKTRTSLTSDYERQVLAKQKNKNTWTGAALLLLVVVKIVSCKMSSIDRSEVDDPSVPVCRQHQRVWRAILTIKTLRIAHIVSQTHRVLGWNLNVRTLFFRCNRFDLPRTISDACLCSFIIFNFICRLVFFLLLSRFDKFLKKFREFTDSAHPCPSLRFTVAK